MTASARYTPLPTRIDLSQVGVVDHLMQLTARVNAHTDVLSEVEAKMLLVAGETSRSNGVVVDQVNKLTDAMRELREVLLPNSEHRKELVTLPDIVVEEVNAILADKELQKRRTDSLRARAASDEKRHDARVAWYAFWGLFAAAFLGELARLLITHQL
jgi:hypothetical protein